MRLKIKRLLKDGEYFVSFKSLGFNTEETEIIKRWGMPTVDLSSLSLGRHKLDQIDFFISCSSTPETEQMIAIIKDEIKNKINQLTALRNNFIVDKKERVFRRKRTLSFGFACVFALFLFFAYNGVISSQKITKQLMQSPVSTLVNNSEEITTVLDEEGSFNALETSLHGPIANVKSEEIKARTYPKVSFRASSPEIAMSTKPGFTLTVVPETLMRYSDWESNVGGGADKAEHHHFKIILTPLGGFDGPVTIGVTGSSPLLNERLYPERIEKLPGSSTLLISVSPQTLPQICPEITVIARGKTPEGDLITQQKKLMVAVHQRSSYQGPIWHVSTRGSDQSGDGGWGSPFRTIQRAIDCASAGDTVLVEKGVYRENISLINKDGILLVSHYIFDQKESTIRSTIIEAKDAGWVVTIGRGNDVTLQGFTIQNGRGVNGSQGGGIYCYNSNLNILDNVITHNENHSGYGAGIYCYKSEPRILRNHVIQNYNYDGHGSGIYCYQSDLDIQHNVIKDNFASGGGSGIHLLEPNSCRMARNLICSDSGRAAIVLYNKGIAGNFPVVNNTISHNYGDAIRFFGGSWSFENNIISHNEGYGLFTLGGTVYLSHNNIWGNVSGSDTLNYYGLKEDPTGKNGNISEDPCFGNPVHENFHLCFNSPCINSGDPNYPTPPEGGERIDLGALEYTSPDKICGDVNGDGFVDFGDINYLINFLYRMGSVPYTFKMADVNCDDEIDKSDFGYLYKFLYYYGPEPCSDCRPKDRLTER